MSKAWGKIGAWAAEAEREEEEEAAAAAAAATATPADSQSFPSLREAVKEKPKKKKMTLSEFYTAGGGSSGPVGGAAEKLTPAEMMRLPTAPRERSAEEMRPGGLGGGFSNYGGGGGRRSYGGGGFDDERRGPGRVEREMQQPSRADGVDNWAMGKKASFGAGFERGERQSRYGSLGGGDGSGGGGGFSRADGVDSWSVGKKPISGGYGDGSGGGGRSSSFGSGFGGPRPEPDRWTRGGMGGGSGGGGPERPKLVLDPPKGDSGVINAVKNNKPNPFGQARPREEVLADKGLDWKKIDDEIEAKKTSRPSSAQSSRPSSAQSARSETQGTEGVVKPRPKVNPFGEAKPREVLLAEKGVDWRKIDLELEHKRIDRPETEEEKTLKAEIVELKRALEKEPKSSLESGQEPDANQPNLQEIIQLKEQELETLIHDLDDKVRFGAKAAERPPSGAGRGPAFSDRPPSRSGSFDEHRSTDYMDRPRSRGKVDVWTRPGEERRGYQGGRERGFSRDFNRSTSRERW